MKKKILFLSNYNKKGFTELENDFEFVFPEGNYIKKERAIEILKDFDVLVPGSRFRIDKKIIDSGKNLKLIANHGVGYNNIDVDYAAKKGIIVTNTPNSVLEPTAELAFGLLITAARKISFYDRHLREKNGLSWKLYDNLGVDIYGKTLGIFGMGRIGQAIARRAVAAGMSIIYHNTSPLEKQIEEKYNAKYVSFEELLSDSDFISLNAPATTETFHIIAENEFNKMKSSAIIINAARGTLIKEEDLIKALSKRRIAGAGLDVFETEPCINPKLLKLDNVVLSPHAGTRTIEARLAMVKEVATNIKGFFAGDKISRVN